jgi:branched-subunit amino acid transport protein
MTVESRGQWALKILRFMTKDEVKTPLAFLYKILPYVPAILIVALFAPVAEDLKRTVILWSFIGLFGLAGIVLLCALWKPKNLVYGESGHRAERKVEYGTEAHHSLDREEIDSLSVTSNPDLPRLERRD